MISCVGEDATLLEWAERQRLPLDQNSIRKAFHVFDSEHPEVFEMFEKFAFEAVQAGTEKLGAAAVWERMRWETAVGQKMGGGPIYRLNNNFRAYYARKFMQKHPECGQLFETRKVRS